MLGQVLEFFRQPCPPDDLKYKLKQVGLCVACVSEGGWFLVEGWIITPFWALPVLNVCSM